MKMKVATLAVAFLSAFASTAHADGWIKRLDCGDSTLLVVGANSYESGFTEHRLVIRSSRIVSYLSSLVSAPLPLNSRGELILSLGSGKLDGEFNAVLFEENLEPGVNRAYLKGHWTGTGLLEIDVTSVNAGPGWGGEPHFLGKWVLNGCSWIR